MHFTLFRSGKKSNLFWIFFLFRLCKCYKKTIFTKSTLCKALVVIMQSIYFFIRIFFRHFISDYIIQLKIYYRWDNLVALFYKSGAKCTLLSKKWWMQWIDITINLDIFSDLNEMQVLSSSNEIIIWSLRTIKNKSKERLTIWFWI